MRQIKYRLTNAYKCECTIDLFNDAKTRCENKLKDITDKLLKMSDSEIEKKYDERLEGDWCLRLRHNIFKTTNCT